MQSEWPQVRLGDYVDSCLGKMLDKEKNRGELFPYLGNKNVRWASFDTDDLAQMRFEEHEHERYGLKYGDLVVCEGGEPGRCAIWKEQIPDMKIQKALHRIRPYNGLNNVYLHYWFLWAGKTGALEPFFTGTTIKHLTGRALADLQIPLPSIEIQDSIANILGSLDDKIELNRQMNATLEAMAQALFKSWFVDFDPVLDNALAAGNPIPDELQDKAAAREALGDARKPLPGDIAALFPAAFVWTEEMGWIPGGWDVGVLSDVAALQTVSIDPGKQPDKEWFHFSIPAFDENKTPSIDFGHTIKSGKYKVPPTCVLASKLNPQFPRVWLPDILDEHTAICSTEFMPFVPVDPAERSFLYALLTSDFIQTEIANRATGSTGSRQRVKPREMADLPIVSVPKTLRLQYSKLARDYFERVSAGMNNISALTQLRDTLLPKLLSGELRIPDAEKRVGT